MANSRVGNYQLEYNLTGYEDPIRAHTHSVYVAPTTLPSPGTPPADIDIQLLGGGTDTLQVVANTYGSFLRTLYDADITLSNFTLWRYATENSRDFVTAGTLTLSTSGNGNTAVAHQHTITYRTAGGSILKQVFIEGNVGTNDKKLAVPDASGSRVEKMIAFVLSADSPVVGIDNTFPVSGLFDARGQNERVWRKVYRQ